MTILQRMMRDAAIREADTAFLHSSGIAADFEPTPELVSQEN